jgi:hypothetical protein
MLFKTLKENRKLLNTPLGFARVPNLLSDRGEISAVQNELIDKDNSVTKIAYNLIENFMTENSLKINFDENLNEIFRQISENMRFNPRGKAAFWATKHFQDKKNKVISYLEKIKYKETAKTVEKWEDPCDADKIAEAFDFKSLMGDYLQQHPIIAIKGILKNLLGMRIDKLGQKNMNVFINLHKLLITRTKDHQVRAIENKIKKKYGLELVNLDNLQDAKIIQKGLQLAKENNIPLPKSIVVTPFMDIDNAGCNFTRDKIIFINSNAQQGSFKPAISRLKLTRIEELFLNGFLLQSELNKNSTNNSVHNILHELVHGENPDAYIKVKIPQKFYSVVENLGDYAESSFNKNNEEIRTELRTKQILEGLNREEQELLDLLQSKIKTKH